MTLPLVVFNDLVQRFATSARASTTKALDFTVGSLFRALAEGMASVALWLQWETLVTLRQTRLATSLGSEVDTFVGDFGLVRLPAVPSAGSITLSRYATGLAALIPVGAGALTTDRTQSFVIVADPTNIAYSAASGGYLLNSATSSITVAATSAAGGAASNVQPNSITVLTTAIPGIDTVSNAGAFVGGFDAESDAALQARFALFIAGLSKGTQAAIGAAIAGVQQGLTYYLGRNVNTLGNYQPGNFVLTIDDGSGAPSATLQAAVYTAVDLVRAVGETFSVRGPAIVTVSISMTIAPLPGYLKVNLQGPVALAVTAYINSLGVAVPLNYAKIGQIAYSIPGVATVSGVLASGAQADVSVTAAQVIKAGTVAIN